MIKIFESKKGHKIETKIIGEEIFLKLEDVANGLDLTKVDKKNGKEYKRIHMQNIKKWLHQFGFTKSELNKDDFITESQFYWLVMKAKNELALVFQTWICIEVLPSIRKNGCYISDKITESQIKEAKKYLNITQIKKIMKTCLATDLEYNYKLAVAGIGSKDKDKLDGEVIKILRNRSVSVEGQELIYKIVEKRNKKMDRKIRRLNKLADKLEDDINNILPKETDYTEINAYGFSVNAMYIAREEHGEVKMRRSARYNNWRNNFPYEQLPDVNDIDFNKRVNVWLEFDHYEKFDCPNLHKSLIDVACNYWGVDDKNIQLMRCVSRKKLKKKDTEKGKIYICVRQGED